MKGKIIRNRFLSALLALVLVFSAMPAQPVQAAGKNNAPLSEELFMRGTTIMFVATTVLIDTSEYYGSVVDAYNEFVIRASNGKIPSLVGTPFHKVFTVDISARNQNVYFLDTISTSLIRDRYFGGNSRQAVLVNLKDVGGGGNTLAIWVGAIMNSPAMNGGIGTVLNPEDYLGETPEKELKFVETAIKNAGLVNTNLTIPVLKISGYGVYGKHSAFAITQVDTDGAKLIADDSVKKTYDWSERDAYIIMTVMQPVIIPTFNNASGSRAETKLCSLVKGNYFYSNIGYLMSLVNDSENVNSFNDFFSSYPIKGTDPFVLEAGEESYDYNTKDKYRFYTNDGVVSSTNPLGQAMYQHLTGNAATRLVSMVEATIGTVCQKDSKLSFQDFCIVAATLSGLGAMASVTSKDSILYTMNSVLNDFYTGNGLSENGEYVIKDNGPFSMGSLKFVMDSASSEIYAVFCSTTASFNISNILWGKSYCAGVLDNTLTGDARLNTSEWYISYHNTLPVWYATKVPYYGVVQGLSSYKKYYCLPANCYLNDNDNNGNLNIVPSLWASGSEYKMIYMPYAYVVSNSYGFSYEKLIVNTYVEGDNYVYSASTASCLSDQLKIKAKSDFAYELMKSLLSKNDGSVEANSLDLKSITYEDSELMVIIPRSESASGYKLKITFPTSEVTETVEYETGVQLVDLWAGPDRLNFEDAMGFDFTVVGNDEDKNTDLTESIANMDDMYWKHVKSKFAANESIVEIVNPVLDGDFPRVQDGSKLGFYQGLSLELFPSLKKLPVSSIKASTTLVIKQPGGKKEFTVALGADADLEKLNEAIDKAYHALSKSDKYVLEAYDVEYEAGKESKELEKLKWEITVKEGSTVKATYICTITPTVHKWSTDINTEIVSPEKTPASTPVDVKVTAESIIGRGADDKSATALMTGIFNVTHALTSENRLTSEELTSEKAYMEGKITSSELSISSKEKRTSYADTNVKITYAGGLNMPEGAWVVKDTVTIYAWSYSAEEFKEILKFDKDITFDVSDTKGTPAKFDKDEADPNEEVVLSIETFKLSDFLITETDTSKWKIVSKDTENVSIPWPAEIVLDKNKENANVSVVVKFTEKGTYKISNFYLEAGSVRVPLEGDNTDEKFPYGTCVVPRKPKPLNPFTITISDGGNEFKDAGNVNNVTRINTHTLSIGTTDSYKKWADDIDATKTFKMVINIGMSASGAKLKISEDGKTISGLTLKTSDDGKTLTLTGTGKAFTEAVTSGLTYSFNIDATRTVAATDIKIDGEAKAVLTYQYKATPGTKYTSEFKDSYVERDGSNVIKASIPKSYCEPWTFITQTKDPYAVLTSTLPSPSKWRWDAMSGIPCTETLSATIGADIFKIGITGRTHSIGKPLTSDSPYANDADEVNNVENPDAALKRTIAFKVNVHNWWNTDNPPCSLSCSGHNVCNGGTSGGNSCNTSVTASTSNGTTVTKTATCPGLPEWECPMCSYKYPGHASHVITASATGKDAYDDPAKKDPETGATIKGAHHPAVGASNTASCSPSWTHDCHWSCTYYCSTGQATVSGGEAHITDLTTELNSNDQLYNLINVTVEQEEEVVTGSYSNEGLIDKGYTVGYGCKCSNTTNCIHQSTAQRTYNIVETVDAIAWNNIDNFYINILQGATIQLANDIFVEGTAGQSILNTDGSFNIWRADDKTAIATCDAGANVAGCAQSLIGTGRIYFTEFPNATHSMGFYGTTITDDYAAKDNVVIEINIMADSGVADEANPGKVDAYPSSITTRGSAENHFQSVDSNKEDFREQQGDMLTAEQITNQTLHAVNAWLNANNASIYKCNIISDTLAISAMGKEQNVIGFIAAFGSPINLCNVPFSSSTKTVYRNHVSGYNNNLELGSIARSYGKVSDLPGGYGVPRVGYSGVYAPSNEGAMYVATCNIDTPGILIDDLDSQLLQNWNGIGGTSFNRHADIGTNPYAPTLADFYGNHRGQLSLSGSVDIQTEDEFYGKCVADVGANALQVIEVDGTELKSKKGSALLPMDVDGVYITDATKLSFLGLKVKDDTPNQVVRDALTIQCIYSNMVKYISNDKTSAIINAGAKDSLEKCIANENSNDTINPIIIMNPIAVSSKLVPNNYGDTSVYTVDESNEDDRINSEGVDNKNRGSYVVIGNTLELWVSNFVLDDIQAANLQSNISTKNWGSGVSSDITTGGTIAGESGIGENLNTAKWLEYNSVQFSFPVSYVNLSGELIHAKANEEIDLRNVKSHYTGPAGSDFASVVDNCYGTAYTFTVELSAKESSTAKYIVRAYAINSTGMESPERNNALDRTSYNANDIVKDYAYVEMVGRIGDLTLTDTQDYRFSNLFWKPVSEWLIPNVIKKVGTESLTTMRTKYNILMKSTIPAYGTILEDAASHTGITSIKEAFPLCGVQNNIKAFKSTNLGLGYSAYLSLSTTGNYTGKNDGRTYPKSFLEQDTVVDQRNNIVEIIPIYVLFDKDTETFHDIDLYAGSATKYDLFYNSQEYQPNYTNALHVSLDDALEQSRYCISNFAKNYSLLFNNTLRSAFTENTYVGTSGKVILDERANIVIGTRYENSTPVSYSTASNRFVFSNYIANKDTATTGLQSNADYALNTRRWFFNLGLPSSVVATYPGVSNTPLAITASNKKLLEDHPNSVIVVFARIRAMGDTYTLQYDFAKANGTSVINIDGKTVNYVGKSVYINGVESFKLRSVYAPLFVCDVTRTSTQDLGMEGTH